MSEGLNTSLSARRPAEIPTGEQVKVQVSYRLTAGNTAVIDNSPAVFCKAHFIGELCRNGKDMSDHRRGIIIKLVRRSDMRLWNNDDMYRGLRLDVIECINGVILINLC